MDSFNDANTSGQPSPLPETIQTRIDRQLFYLKTLYDVSHELLGAREIRDILKSFLLMTMGSFGVAEGFVLLNDSCAKTQSQLTAVGIDADIHAAIIEGARRILAYEPGKKLIFSENVPYCRELLGSGIICVSVFHVDEGCSGVLGLGCKIIEEPYSQEDQDLLSTLVNNLVVSLKNARATEALKEANDELTVLSRAKDKLIDHLSHELQTPVALLISALRLLKKQLTPIPAQNWQRIMERAERSLKRLVEMQSEVEDILQKSGTRNGSMISGLLDRCADALEVFASEQFGTASIVEKIRERIDELFGSKAMESDEIDIQRFVQEKFDNIRPHFAHRQLNIIVETEPTPRICIPPDLLEKLVVGLIKNAVEYTPDEGRIEIRVRNRKRAVEFAVVDFGIGIAGEHQEHIFEGFYPTQETHAYSTRKPFDFNAGGKGADLLRMKIFSERYHFKLEMSSTRCHHIAGESDACPGKISLCAFCRSAGDCIHSGKTTIKAVFPASDALE